MVGRAIALLSVKQKCLLSRNAGCPHTEVDKLPVSLSPEGEH